MNKLYPVALFLLLCACSTHSPPPTPLPSADWTLRGTHDGKAVVVSANRRFGAAIYSITWGGFEFIDSSDHGRELQTAWQLNNLIEGENPTEAGSADDGAGPSSSTRIISAGVAGNALTSSVNPAYWLVFNGQRTSPHKLDKTVALNGNVLHHKISMTLVGEHKHMGVEGITGYVPRTFTRFFSIENGMRVEKPAPPKTGWQMRNADGPVIVFDGTHAIGCRGPGYGYGFIDGWPKFNCAGFAVSPATGTYSWEATTVFGTLDQVTAALSGGT